jgi:hypothetical protein
MLVNARVARRSYPVKLGRRLGDLNWRDVTQKEKSMYVALRGYGLQGFRGVARTNQPTLGDDFNWSGLTTSLINAGGAIAGAALAPSPPRPPVVQPTTSVLGGTGSSSTLLMLGGGALLLVLVLVLARR